MRSIRYIIGGNPHNLDDCVDMIENKCKIPKRVSLELSVNEIINEVMISLKQLIGHYRWEFKDKTVDYEDIYGGCFYAESEKRQKKSIDNANKRLSYCISRINDLGIAVQGEEKRFPPSWIYSTERAMKK